MTTETKPTLRNEEAAERRTNIAGWVCKTCRRFFGDEDGAERMARYCCEKDHACDTEGCTTRAEKPYIYCPPCIAGRDRARWEALVAVPWDGETPLCLHDSDVFFHDEDALQDYLDEHGLKREEIRLVICVEEKPRSFDMVDHLSDYLDPDGGFGDDGECREIDKTVNDWIEKNVPTMWTTGTKRPTAESLPEPTVPQVSNPEVTQEPLPPDWDESPKGCWAPHPLTRTICQLPPDGHEVHKNKPSTATWIECWR